MFFWSQDGVVQLELAYASCGVRLQTSSSQAGWAAERYGTYRRLASRWRVFRNDSKQGRLPLKRAIGLASACTHLEGIGMANIIQHERALTELAYDRLTKIGRIKFVGPRPPNCAPIIAFHVQSLEAHGVARLLSARFGIMVRSGFHCAEPLHKTFNWRPTVRATFSHFNTRQEVEQLAGALSIICGV